MRCDRSSAWAVAASGRVRWDRHAWDPDDRPSAGTVAGSVGAAAAPNVDGAGADGSEVRLTSAE